jgi:glucokinase
MIVGIEIGGTKLQAALAEAPDRIVRRARLSVDPARGAAGIRADLAATLASWRGSSSSSAGPIEAIGIGFGGPVDAGRGRAITSHQVAGWDDFDLAAWCRDELRIPRAVIHNDADAAALAEACVGAGAGLSPVLYVNSGSGVGGGLVIDGRIYRGGSGRGALEIGHLRLGDDLATIEDHASGWAIDRKARELVTAQRAGERPRSLLFERAEGDPGRVNTALVGAAALDGDEQARAPLREAAHWFARGLAAAATLLAPRRIVLGGGVSLLADSLWIEPIREEVARRVFPAYRGTFDIVPAALGEDVVLVGALRIAQDCRDDGRSV